MDREYFWVVFWILLAFALGFCCGGAFEMNRQRNEAIDHGVAEWRIDRKTGDKSFVWLDGKESK